jgi:hypothetical protein
MSAEARAERLARIDAWTDKAWMDYFASLRNASRDAELHRKAADRFLEQRFALMRNGDEMADK